MHLPQYPLPALGKMMVFIDGENLVTRYEDMVGQKWEPNEEKIQHRKDVFVWDSTSLVSNLHTILRATYYTYVQGSPEAVADVEATIKSFTFHNYSPPGARFGHLPNRLTPCVFSKPKGRKAKGVDIQLTVDILTHAYQNNCDTIHLMSGDGDYLPVLQEVQRLGKQVVVSAFSSGLNSRLRLMADCFYCLDSWYFSGLPEGIDRPQVWDTQG
nr:NYN domain-containing protein [uncultured Noviherbaspirillum sp.]